MYESECLGTVRTDKRQLVFFFLNKLVFLITLQYCYKIFIQKSNAQNAGRWRMIHVFSILQVNQNIYSTTFYKIHIIIQNL